MSLFPDVHHSAFPGDGDGCSTAPFRQIIVIDRDNIWPGKKIGTLLSTFPELAVQKHVVLDEWLNSPAFSRGAMVLLCFQNQLRSEVPESLGLDCNLLRGYSDLPYAFVADRDEAPALSGLLSLGVCGFLSADLPVEIFVQALVLISRGARFFTPSCFTAENQTDFLTEP